MMTPEEFRNRWGDDLWIKPPAASLEKVAISSEAKAVLLEAGLPWRIVIQKKNWLTLQLDWFKTEGLVNLEELMRGSGDEDEFISQSWASLWVICWSGAEGGSGQILCFDDRSGIIVEEIPELADENLQPNYVSSSFQAFFESILAFRIIFDSSPIDAFTVDETRERGNLLESVIRALDPKAVTPGSYWEFVLQVCRGEAL